MRLERLSRPLQPRRAPWYVRLPVDPGLERTFPAAGWYWIPDGHETAVYLGSSFEVCAHNLYTMIENAA